MMNEADLPKYTLCLLIDHGSPVKVLLGYKLSGFGVGNFTGFGGKVEPGEEVVDAALRELWEECSVRVDRARLRQAGELSFILPHRPSWSQKVYVYLASKWQGQPELSEEMSPTWFLMADIPYDRM